MDHNQESQIAPGLNINNICGVIDHHALQSGTVITEKPVYIDIRPWGSACTIVAHTFLRIRKPIPSNIAGILLSGILSDTLNLRSPTTTDHDKLLVAVLAKVSGCNDIDGLADKQFAAKSAALMHVSPYEVACGDQKKFNIKCADGSNCCIGFGVVETTDPVSLETRIDELMIEVAALKSEQKLDFSFLAIVDIVKLTSKLILIGKSESELAAKSFGLVADCPEDDGIGTMKLEGMVSRKLDFIPKITDAIVGGFMPSAPAVEKTEKQKAVVVDDVYGIVNKEWSVEACCSVLVRRMKKGAMRRVSSFANMAVPGGGWATNLTQMPALSRDLSTMSEKEDESPSLTRQTSMSTIGGAQSPVAPLMYSPESITTGAGAHTPRTPGGGVGSPTGATMYTREPAAKSNDGAKTPAAAAARTKAGGGGGGVSNVVVLGAVGLGVVLGVVASRITSKK
jgi:inorganic pyrophosphatase/exopolyphosphatase